jgi:serine/threonine-protein kinase
MRTLGDIQPGQTLGRYEFLVPIAQGGMAAVWAARLKGSRGFSKTVAIKTMLPTISDDPSFEQMFLDEAQLASRIRHPNVVEILDLGEQDDVLYLVMEWVDGEPLSTLRRVAAKRGGIPRPIAVRIVADVCAGLHAAHELRNEDGTAVGLVHRDLSPHNVLITFNGVVKIVDFGVALAVGRTATNTGAGHVKGKPPFMSPEQALGYPIDRRSDLFALGIVLYQLTTGKHPFRGDTDILTLQNIVSDRPVVPPRELDPEYPKPLEAAVLKALERDPDKRFQTAGELGAALERVFPPTVPRVRAEDVGKLVMQMLGDVAEERREALRQAIREADVRPATDANGEKVASDPFASTVADPPTFARPVADVAFSSGSGTPYGTQSPSDPPLSMAPRARGALWIAGGIAAAALAIGSAVIFTNAVQPPAAEEPRASTSLSTAAAAAPATPPVPEQHAAVSPHQLALEAVPAAASAAPVAASRPKAATTRKSDSKKRGSSKKDTNGFVPPPVTDPGF